MLSQSNPIRRAVTLLTLIAAGEAAFFLPFLLARVFRPTVLDVFDVTNLELGTAYGVYGVVAMAAYFAGGPLADRFPARQMLAVALASTAAGGLVLLSLPPLSTLIVLYAVWGITTIALFWAPLIRATREWGGALEQGRAFGLLDGGRGLLAAVLGSVMVSMFAALLPADPDTATLAQRSAALREVILVLLTGTGSIAVLVWFALPATPVNAVGPKTFTAMRGLTTVARLPTVWLQAIIVLCAYVGFRAVDDFPLYAYEVLGMDEVAAARLSTVSLWVRPVAAVGAGFLADRFCAIRMTQFSFVLLVGGSLILASEAPQNAAMWLFLLAVITASVGVFALRGLYYAIMQEGKVPLAVTGTAVGVVSFFGYTPDVFMGPVMGWLLDRSPGAAGHQDLFLLVAGFAAAGFAASQLFRRLSN